MNLPGEPDEQKKKTFIRKISKHHFDIQKEKLICSQSSDVFFSCSVPNTNIKFGCYVFKYVYSARKDYLNYLANAKKDSVFYKKQFYGTDNISKISGLQLKHFTSIARILQHL